MINIYNNEKYDNLLTATLEKALAKFEISAKEIEIEMDFLDETEMRQLNNDEREIDSITDVLSFPSIEIKYPFLKSDYTLDIDPETDRVILGDIYICTERAAEQAKEFGHSIARETAFLALHGALHLMGLDHIEETDRVIMEKMQDEILDSLNITREMTEEVILANFANFVKADDSISEDLDEDEFEDEEDEDLDEESEDTETVEAEKPIKRAVSANFRSGYIAIVGRPNSGKSTLVNALVGEKVSIVSWKPQTTRDKILGIVNSENSQIVLIDTPGLHAPKNQLGKFMMKNVTKGLEDADGIIYVIDGEKGMDEIDSVHINKYIKNEKKIIVTVNKIDHITKLRVMEILSKLNGIDGISAILPISALREKNLDVLIKETTKLLTHNEKYFDEDLYTDKNMRFIAAEIIREKALRLLDKEIPYGVGVSINKYEYSEKEVLVIDAEIICEKQAHKPIILGKNGDMIKKIGTYARQDLEKITGSKIFITIWVRVKEDWREDSNLLNQLGYTEK